MPAAKSLLTKLEDKILVGDECWEWTGAKSGGYGSLKVDGRMAKAHRLVYELLVGPIPEGLELDHLCRKASHLEPVTHAENVRRGRVGENSKVKTHCPQGHPYAGDNLVRTNGRRVCRTCRNASSLRHFHRKRGQS